MSRSIDDGGWTGHANHADWWRRGEELLRTAKFSELVEFCDKAIEESPHFGSAWILKGAALTELGDYSEANECLGRAVELAPNSYDTWIRKGNVVYRLGQSENALKYYDKAI